MNARRRGMTIVELLIVMAIVSVLMGLGIGVLSRLATRNRLEATQGGIRALLRAARNASLQERYGVVVTVDPERSVVSAQLKTHLTAFRFEASEVTGGTPLDPSEEEETVAFELTGVKDFTLQVEDGGIYDPGRTGTGLLFARPEAWAWLDDAPILRPLEGIHVEVAVLPGDLDETLYERAPSRSARDEERHERAGPPALPFALRELKFDRRDPPRYHVVHRGRAWGLAITANYELEVSLSGFDEFDNATVWVARTKPETLAPNVWYRLAMAFDGGPRPRVWVDGIPRGLYPVDEGAAVPVRLVEDEHPISLSDSHPDRGFFGAIDELRLSALVRSEALEIPADMVLITAQGEISFDMLGQLDPSRHPEAVTVFLCDDPQAMSLLEPATGSPQGTRTQADLERERAAHMGLGEQRVAAFEKLLEAGSLPDGSWAELTIERTGLVR